MSYYNDYEQDYQYDNEYPSGEGSPVSPVYSSSSANSQIPDDEPDVEILTTEKEEQSTIDRYITRYKIFFDKQKVENVDKLIPLSKDGIIAKMQYSVKEGVFLTEYDGLNEYQLREIKVFKCSENNFRNVKEKGYKTLFKGVTYFLYAEKDFTINGKIVDTGVVRMDVNFHKYNFNDIAVMEDKIKSITTSMYKSIFGVDSEAYIVRYIDIKLIYREYYLSNDHFSTIVKGELKNNMVKFEYKDIKMTYSSKKDNMNFIVRKVEDVNKVIESFEKIELLIDYMKNNHEIEKNKKETSNIKKIKNAGLETNSYKCEKKRQPLIVEENEVVEENVEVFEKEGKRFKCNTLYPYHGKNGKVDCCYKKKPSGVKKSGGIKENIKLITKYSTLKNYANLSKYKKSIISDKNIKDSLTDKFSLLSVGDEKYDKTIENCLSEMYNIERSIQSISVENYEKYISNGLSIDAWTAKTSKSIEDILLAVQLTNDVSIIILHSTVDGVRAKCPIMEKKSKYVFIQEHEGMYFIIIENIMNDIIYEFSKDNPVIKNLVNLAKESCEQLIYTTRDYKDSDIQYEILDINNLVVFLQTSRYGIVPVTPSSASNLPDMKIQNASFLTPDDQYNKLLQFDHKPIGYTTILDTDIVTGIKLSNGLISPVINKEWVNLPAIPKIEELFYIERYFNEADVFEEENKTFLSNLEKIKEIDVETLIATQDFKSLIIKLKSIITDENELTKVVWYLLNK